MLATLLISLSILFQLSRVSGLSTPLDVGGEEPATAKSLPYGVYHHKVAREVIPLRGLSKRQIADMENIERLGELTENDSLLVEEGGSKNDSFLSQGSKDHHHPSDAWDDQTKGGEQDSSSYPFASHQNENKEEWADSSMHLEANGDPSVYPQAERRLSTYTLTLIAQDTYCCGWDGGHLEVFNSNGVKVGNFGGAFTSGKGPMNFNMVLEGGCYYAKTTSGEYL